MIGEKTQPHNVSDFIFESIVLQSDRTDITVDLRNVVTDIEIYESLNQSYLTADLLFIDNDNLLARFDIQGGEKISIEIKVTNPLARKIKKTFYIESIEKIKKVNDNTEVISLNLVEDCFYISKLQNISRYYSGAPIDIIKKIAKEYLNRDIITTASTSKPMNVIVPNMDPITAMQWLRDTMSTDLGYPYCLFSTLFTDVLLFADLDLLLNQEAINSNTPFRRMPASLQNDDPAAVDRIIKQHRFEESNGLLDFILRGNIGSEIQYIDTLTNKKNTFNFDVIEDVIKPVSAKLPRRQRNMTISPLFEHNGKRFSKYKSKKISLIGGSNAFKTNNEHIVSYNESKTISEYKLNAKVNAIHNILMKTPLTITISGNHFLQGDGHYTIGNNLQIEFLNSFTNTEASVDKLDRNKSGSYLIYATRHMFKKEKYDMVMTGVKLANMDQR